MIFRLGAPALFLLMTACSDADVSADSVATPTGYREAAAALDTAISAKDAPTLRRLIADDFLWVRGSGVKGDKSAFIGALTAPSIRIEPFQPSEARWIVADRTALLTATNTLRGTAGGEAFVDRHRYADHWLWRGGAWRLVYAQVTPVPEPVETDTQDTD